MPAANGNTGKVARHQGTGDSKVFGFAHKPLGVVQPKGQTQHGAYRGKRDVALVPAYPHAHHLLTLPLAFTNNADIWNGGSIRARPWAGQSKGRNLNAFCKPRQVVLFLFLGAVVKKQLARAKRVGHHHRHRQGRRPGGEPRKNLRLSIGRELKSAIGLRNNHAQKALVFNKLPGLRRHVVGFVRDRPFIYKLAGLNNFFV